MKMEQQKPAKQKTRTSTTKKRKSSTFHKTTWAWFWSRELRLAREQELSIQFDKYQAHFFKTKSESSKAKMLEINIELEDMMQLEATLWRDVQTVPSNKTEEKRTKQLKLLN